MFASWFHLLRFELTLKQKRKKKMAEFFLKKFKLKKNVQPEKIANWRSNRHKHTALKLLESLRPKKLMTFQILHILSLFLLPFSPSNVIKTLHVSRVLAHKFYLQKQPAGGSEARFVGHTHCVAWTLRPKFEEDEAKVRKVQWLIFRVFNGFWTARTI